MIDSSQLDALARRVTALGFSAAGMAEVRAGFPDLRLTFCLEEELGPAEPFREYAGFSLHLVGGDHCLALTDDPARAVGVLVAEAS